MSKDQLYTTKISSFSNYAHWLNNMYVLTGNQNVKWHGYVLINQFDYDDWFNDMSNTYLVKFDPKKITLVKRNMFWSIRLITKRSNKQA
jgi:hypothetical protein